MLEHVGLIVVVNFALYLKTLRFKFVSDDFSVWRNPPVPKNLWHKLWLRFTGATKYLSKSVHFVMYNGKPHIVITKTEEAEHLLALLIHTALCVSIYFAFGSDWVSFCAAILYSTNPVNNQGTIWPGGRGYVLPALCLVLSMAVPILSPALLYFCSWYTIGFLAPLVLIGSKSWYLLGLMPFIWFLHSRKYTKAITLKQKMENFDEDKRVHLGKLVVFFKTYGFYLLLCLFPSRITFYHNFLQSMAGNDIMQKRAYKLDRYFLTGITAWLGTLYYAITCPGTLSWSFLAFLIGILPFCNIVRANQEIAERFVALPNIFLMYGLAQLVSVYPPAFTAITAFYATRTFYTLDQFRDEYWITEKAVAEDPHAWWAWHCRAMKRWETQSYREALILWTMARLISPKEFKVLINIASCLRLLKNDKESEEFLKLAEQNIVKGQEKEAMQFISDHRAGKLPILL